MDIKHVLSDNPLHPAYDAVRLPRPTATPTAHLDRASRRAPTRSATPAPGSASTTSCPDTGCTSTRSPSPTRRSPAASGWPSSTTAATGAPSSGCPTGGRRCRPNSGSSPLYWYRSTAAGRSSPWGGPTPVNPAQPVCHLSYYEADAYRPLGRGPAPHRGRVGGGCGRRNRSRATSSTRPSSIPPRSPADTGATALRRRLAVDLLGLQPVPGVRARPRRGRRVQRQVHGQPVRAAGRVVRDPARPRPRHPTGTSSLRPPAGPSPGCGWPETADPGPNRNRSPPLPDGIKARGIKERHELRHPTHHRCPPVRRRPAGGHGARRPQRAVPPGPRASPRSTSTTTGAAACSTRSPGCPSTTRPGRSGRSSTPTPRTSPSGPGPTPWSSWAPAPATSRGSSSTPCRPSGTCARFVPLDVSDTTLWEAATALSRSTPAWRSPPWSATSTATSTTCPPAGGGCSPSSAAPSAISTPRSAATSCSDWAR